MKIDEFHMSLEREGLSVNTIMGYLNDVNLFARHYQLDHNGVIKYLNDSKSNATKFRRYSSILKYDKFLTGCSGFGGFMNNINPPIYEKYGSYEYLTDEETKKFLDAFDCINPLEYRDKVMVLLVLNTGMKISEVIDLELSDIDNDSCRVTLNNRDMFYNEDLSGFIDLYIRSYRKEILISYGREIESKWLFPSKKGENLNRKSVWRRMNYFSKKASLGKDVSPQILRNTFIADLILNGATKKEVKEMGNYSDIETVTKVFIGMGL